MSRGIESPDAGEAGSQPGFDADLVAAHQHDTASLSLTEEVVVDKRDESGRTVGLRSSRSGPKGDVGAGVDVQDDGTIRSFVDGRSPSTQVRETRVAAVLRERLNRSGDDWSSPQEPPVDNGVDRLLHRVSTGDTMELQITTAESDLWRLGGGASASKRRTVAELAREVLDALEKKRLKSPAGVVCAVDTHTPDAHGLVEVADWLKSEHQSAMGSVGFSEVWLVGPDADHTYRVYPA